MRLLLDTEIKRQREGGGVRVQNGLPLPKFQVGPNSAKGAESGGKGRQLRRPFHSDYYFLRKLALPGSGVADAHVALWLQASAIFL